MGDVEATGVADVRLCGCCGQAHRPSALNADSLSRCTRCNAVLARGHRLSIESLLALTLAAALLFCVAQASEMVTVRLQGAPTFATFPEAVRATWRNGEPLVALVAAATATAAPAVLIALRLYLLVPLVLRGRPAAGFVACLRVSHHLSRWSMVEVLTVGALVSIVKVAGIAQAVPGPGLYALCGMTLVLAAMQSAGEELLWDRVP